MSKIDKRSRTSRANLGSHIPQALSQQGSKVVGVRMPVELHQRLTQAAQEAGKPVGVLARDLIAAALT